MRSSIAVAALLLLLAACGDARSDSAASPAQGDRAPAGLEATLEARREGSGVHLRLRVVNTADSALTLEFPSGQRYDFTASRPGGESLWSWSAARSFIAEYGTERLEAGQALEYVERWDPAGVSGDVVVVGTLTSGNLPVVRTAKLAL